MSISRQNRHFILVFRKPLRVDRIVIQLIGTRIFEMAVKSKWFRVATEGATSDGREITKADIVDMAETYNPATYQARVNLEHFRGIVPGGPFDMLGDVLALRTQEDELVIGGKPVKKTCLYAEIAPLASLIELNSKGQKIFTSVEIQPNFAATGRASLVGLAVTDSPASLGSEILTFARQNPSASPFANRKQAEGNLLTEAVETSIEFFDEESAGALETGLVATLTKIFAGLVPPKTEPKPADPHKVTVEAGAGANLAFAAIGESMIKLAGSVEAANKVVDGKLKAFGDEFAALKKSLEQAPDPRRHRKERVDGTDDKSKHLIY